MLNCRRKQAEILAGVCGQREALERRVYEQDVQLELSLDELETSVQVLRLVHCARMTQCMIRRCNSCIIECMIRCRDSCMVHA